MVGPVTLQEPTGSILPEVEDFITQGPPAIYVSM